MFGASLRYGIVQDQATSARLHAVSKAVRATMLKLAIECDANHTVTISTRNATANVTALKLRTRDYEAIP
jgi:hypothetical protein